MENRQKIVVAMSGGVDSAVAAALLKKQGHDVRGVFFRFFEGPGAKKSLDRAKQIARKLEVPLKIVEAQKDFKKRVVEKFIDAHKKGLTPNPCVLCNKEMKFRLLFDLMKKEKADFAATGHYARIERGTRKMKRGTKKEMRVISFKLCEARDKNKDQSYFLYRLTRGDLRKIIFPLGEYEKSNVKKIAQKMKLPASNEESQDICFLGGKPVSDFLKKRLKCGKGEMRDTEGNKLGVHRGLPFYTIGQRKGIEIGGTGPYFVVEKNAKRNELIVSSEAKMLLTKNFSINKANWINPDISFPVEAKAEIRYHADKISARIKKERKGAYNIETERKLRAVTPGQSAVFYENGEVLGGGDII